MISRSLVPLAWLLALAGCGTLQVEIDNRRGLEESVAALALGIVHTCALTAGGEIWCWGTNDHGELGNGTNTIS